MQPPADRRLADLDAHLSIQTFAEFGQRRLRRLLNEGKQPCISRSGQSRTPSATGTRGRRPRRPFKQAPPLNRTDAHLEIADRFTEWKPRVKSCQQALTEVSRMLRGHVSYRDT